MPASAESPVVLFVAAEPRECRGLLRFCTGIRRWDGATRWARFGELAGEMVWMVANGAGSGRARHAAEAVCARAVPRAIASIGFCGALDPALETGQIFVATSVRAHGAEFETCKPVSDRPHAEGVLVSVDRVAQTAEEKRTLAEAGAQAVDMEAGGVAVVAETYGIPLSAVRVVTDHAGESFANDFNSVLSPDGTFGVWRLVMHALGSPRERIPELLRLERRSANAAVRLGEFLASCRF